MKRALGTARDLKELGEQFRAAFIRCDWSQARRLADDMQEISPTPRLTQEQRGALVEKVRRLVAEANARTEAGETTAQ